MMSMDMIILIVIQLMIWIYIMGLNAARLFDGSDVGVLEVTKFFGKGFIWAVILVLPIILRFWMSTKGMI